MSSPERTVALDQPSTACFSVHAAVDVGVMPRLLELFCKRGLMPTRLHASVGGRHADELSVDLEMAGLDPDLAVRLIAEMQQVWGVTLVMANEKRAAPAC
ncbi:MAG: hypothetical protein EXQ97_01275 [Alphaproteobacteria bacterium]|nr:hypothetical protein [Alphaproteobacteria bacterium]